MIYKKTVFVLGAGASAPFGYPTGEKLLNEILKDGVRRQTKQVYYDLNMDITKLDNFLIALRRSAPSSIDAFLEYRTEFIEIGKFAIARALIAYEDENRIYDTPDWYKYLFNKMDSSFEDFDKNQVTFITFNYDRSLDYFLFTALKNKYNKTDDECKMKLSKIPIIHVHGQIGYLPWQSKNPIRSYSISATPQEIHNSSQAIKILHEKDVNSKIFETVNKYLIEAYRVYFLGFGYHRINLERLKIRDFREDKLRNNKDFAKSIIRGTGYHLTQSEMIQIESASNGVIQISSLTNNTFFKTLDFLREHAELD